MRALITGIGGFVASHLDEHLRARGDVVLGTSRAGGGEVVPWDATQGLTLAAERAIRDFAPEVIYHLAALSVPRQCGDKRPTPLAEQINVGGTREMLTLAESLAAPPIFFLPSSCYVYAPVSDEQPAVDEAWPLRPVRAYGQTKLAAENAVREAAERGLPCLITRSFQHTGPRQSDQMILPGWARQLAELPANEPVRAVCLDTWLDLTDVRDMVRAYRQLVVAEQSAAAEQRAVRPSPVAADSENPAVYNVGSGVARRSGDLLQCLLRLAGQPRPVVESSPGRRQHPIADATRLRNHTGWQAAIPLEVTIRDVLDYWLQRKEIRS